jgi:O-antigen/teichoic acid export membrane protein
MLNGATVRSTLHTSGILGVRLLVQAGILVAVARLLGPENYGAFAGATALAVFLGTFGTLGTHLVLISEMSWDAKREIDVLSYAIPVTLVCGSFLLVMYLVVCAFLFSQSKIYYISIVFFGVAELLLQPLLNIISAQFLARDKVVKSQVLMVFPLAVRLVAVIFIAWINVADSMLMYAFFYLLASVFALIFALRQLPEKWPCFRKFRYPCRQEFEESLGYGVLNATAVGPGELDKVLASHVMSSAGAGLYSAATRVMGAVTLPVLALMFSVMPRLFRSSKAPNSDAFPLHRFLLLVSLCYGLFLCAVVWLTAGWLEPLFGLSYVGLAQALNWLVPVIPALILRMAAGNILMTSGRTWVRAGVELAGIFILVLGSVFYAKTRDLEGMVVALGFAEWGMAVLSVGFVFWFGRNRVLADGAEF